MSWNQKEILALPQKSLLERRLTKAFFLKNFTLKASEKKVLNNSIVSMEWLASLKPSTSNIPSLINEKYSFEEIQFFKVKIKEEAIAKHKQVIELIHKHIPYQIFLIVYSDQSLMYSVCDKRINQGEKVKRTIESYTHTPIINLLYKREIEDAFLQNLHFRSLTKTNLETTYQSYIRAIVQYSSASITGKYIVRNQERSGEDLTVLQQIEKLETEIISLKSQIKKATSFSIKTQLNIDLQKKRNRITELHAKLALI